MDEQKAIQRLKNRDIGGLEFLVHKYQVKAVRTAYLITRDIGLAESIVQDCFIQAYRSIRGFDATRPFELWFLRSVVNATVKMMQRSARQVEVGDEMDGVLLAELAERVESVESQVESLEVQRQIWDAMKKLVLVLKPSLVLTALGILVLLTWLAVLSAPDGRRW